MTWGLFRSSGGPSKSGNAADGMAAVTPWRQERIRELCGIKGKDKGTRPKFPEEPKGAARAGW